MPDKIKEINNSNFLKDIGAICLYLNRSPATILKWIREYNLPAAKVGGNWVSVKTEIDIWLVKKVRSETKARAGRR